MSGKTRSSFLSLVIIAVLTFSAVSPTIVHADEGTPPPDTSPTETSSPEETGVPEQTALATEVPVESTSTPEQSATEVPVEQVTGLPNETPVETVSPPTEEVALTEETPVVEEQQPVEPEAAPILEQVPDNTVVTVLNAEGEAQPLTSQESADAILVSDPIWCPQNVATPTPGLNGCTTSYTSFTELLTFLKTNEGNAAYQQAGTIYVQMGNYTGPETSIDFNSYNFTSLNNYNLTVQGGWDPVDYSTNEEDVTNLNVPIVIGTTANPWIGSLTFNNIIINGVSNQTGLTLVSQNDVTLSNVQVTNSLGGVDLNAGGDVLVQNSQFNENKKFGANIKTGGFVDVKNSNFNNNAHAKDPYDGFGLKIDSQGGAFLGTVSASFNEAFGADITSTNSVTVWNSVFNGNLSYTHSCNYTYKTKTHPGCTEKPNGGYGLKIVNTGAGLDGELYLESVSANDNYLYGAHLEGTLVTVTGGDVNGVFKGSTFNENGSGSIKDPKGYGLEILSTLTVADTPRGMDAVTLSNVEANNNQLFGANIQAQGSVSINNSFFDGNKSYYKDYYGYGLQVVTTGGIALNTVSTQSNNLFGAHLEGQSVGIFAGIFSGNGSGSSTRLTGSGLEVVSASNVTLSSVEANNNQLFGADIRAGDWVAIANSFFSGHQASTYSYGLQVVATSSIDLTNVEANDNSFFGAHLVGSNIGISGNLDVSSFNNNKDGLKIESLGVVTIDAIEANNNTISGATISAGGKVTIANSFFSGNLSYKKSSDKGKTYYGYGLNVVTTGGISMSGVSADNNYLYGAHLEGTTILISDSSFSNNGTGVLSDHVGKGLEVKSTGSGSLVDLAGVTANGNQLFGANIQAEGDVSIVFSFFNGNKSYKSTISGKTYDGYGVKVVTTSDVYLSHVEANENYRFGAHLEGTTVDVGASTFSFNVTPTQKGKTPSGRGLEVISTGNTSLWDVVANDNQLFGASIQAGGEVEVVSSIFARNKYTYKCGCETKTGGHGLKVTAVGPITIGGDTADLAVQAFENGAKGAILNGQTTVLVSNSQFNNNGSHGLEVIARGDITLNNVTAAWNKGNGVQLIGICTNTAYVFGGTFAYNSKHGIKIIDIKYLLDGQQTFGGNGSTDVSVTPCDSNGNPSHNGGGNGGSC